MVTYRPLLSNQIRLVHILPVDGQRLDGDDSVSCELTTTTLEGAGVFFALSYVWGDPHDTSQIFLQGEPFTVTINLEHALRQIRNIIGKLPIWIDALSINQNDRLERNKQVQKMHLIYSNAKTVIAWLGPGSDDCDEAIETFDFVGKQLLKHQSLEEILALGSFRTENPAQSKLLISHSDESEFPFDQTWALLQRPLWQRAWITQELYLARSISFVCGQRLVNWHRFLATYTYLKSSCQSFSLSPNSGYQIQWSRLDKALENVDFLLLGSYVHRDSRVHESVSNLLRTIRGRMYASDPRDMIYALLGIARDTAELEIEIEYHKPVSQVYLNVTRALVLRGDLDIISEAQELNRTRRRKLPSWVPDFSKPLAVEPFIRGPSRYPKFSASSNQSMIVSWDSTTDLRILCVSGVRIGHVDGFGPTWNNVLGTSDEAIRAWLENLEKLSKQHKVQYKPDEAIWATPIARSEAGQSSSEILQRHQAYYNAYLNLRLASGQTDTTIVSDDQLISTEPFRCSMNKVAHMRRGFVAAGFLGLGPQAIREKDIVCIIFGAKVPYILRQLPNGSYKVVGDAYVFGLMYDELMKSQELSETFRLV